MEKEEAAQIVLMGIGPSAFEDCVDCPFVSYTRDHDELRPALATSRRIPFCSRCHNIGKVLSKRVREAHALVACPISDGCARDILILLTTLAPESILHGIPGSRLQRFFIEQYKNIDAWIVEAVAACEYHHSSSSISSIYLRLECSPGSSLNLVRIEVLLDAHQAFSISIMVDL
jgi:hypothetical protein